MYEAINNFLFGLFFGMGFVVAQNLLQLIAGLLK